MAMSAILGVSVLLSAAVSARADNSYFINSMWRGFSQSNVTSSTRGATALNGGSTQEDGFLIALLFVEGRWRQVESAVLGDGSVEVLGIGADAGLRAHGVLVPAVGGSSFAHFTYLTGGSRGYFDVVRAFPPGPVVNGIPSDPYRSVFPPGPCVNGKYTNVAGVSGRLGLTHNPSTESGPTAFFTGGVTLHDVQFNIVGAISAYRLTDGGYPVVMLGQSALLSRTGGALQLNGELLPAVRPGDQTHLKGTYALTNADGNVVDHGVFDMPF